MYIKRIFNVINYKGLEDNFNVEFKDINYILGDNAKCKSTVGSIPLWILTGYNVNGSNQEQVANDKSHLANTIASMIFVDNDGREHEIMRSKGKDSFVMLDGVRTTQESLNKFYKDVHAFICAYSPTYFRSLKLAEQRELLLRILPVISSEQAFNLLKKDEQEILEKPIIDIKGFCKNKRQEVKELKSRLDQILGSKQAYIEIALQKEEETKIFDKQKELNELQEKFEELISASSETIRLEDLEKDIKKIEEKINRNIKEELKELQEKYKNENENLNNVNSNTSICPTCKQEVHNENLIKVLTIKYKKNIEKITNDINSLKQETQELLNKKKLQEQKYEIAKTPEMQKINNLKNDLKDKIEILERQKTEIDLFNKEVTIKHNQIMEAKSKLQLFEKEEESINTQIETNNKQIKVATRLNLLVIDAQMNSVRQYLNKVTIEFSKIDEQTGEIKDIYNIKYDGREYEKLSRSYKLRADIEIAMLISKVMKLGAPIFIDDSESITELDTNLDSQIIISLVVKYNELEILYTYPEILNRQKQSIEKRIEIDSNQFLNAA